MNRNHTNRYHPYPHRDHRDHRDLYRHHDSHRDHHLAPLQTSNSRWQSHPSNGSGPQWHPDPYQNMHQDSYLDTSRDPRLEQGQRTVYQEDPVMQLHPAPIPDQSTTLGQILDNIGAVLEDSDQEDHQAGCLGCQIPVDWMDHAELNSGYYNQKCKCAHVHCPQCAETQEYDPMFPFYPSICTCMDDSDDHTS